MECPMMCKSKFFEGSPDFFSHTFLIFARIQIFSHTNFNFESGPPFGPPPWLRFDSQEDELII